MAEDKPSGNGELVNFSVCKAENGFKVSASYEKKKKTISQRAGWVPNCTNEYKDYVYKTDKELIAAIASLVKDMK